VDVWLEVVSIPPVRLLHLSAFRSVIDGYGVRYINLMCMCICDILCVMEYFADRAEPSNWPYNKSSEAF
jgi:hypothetical protein